MDTTQTTSESLAFVMVGCPRCARKVLPWHDLTEAGDIVRRCLRCDTVLDPTEQELALRFSWLEIEQMGYDEREPERLRSRGCSSGDGGCSGACSSQP